ncbi:MAG: hypothetical protein ACRCXC_13260 [Legionella sp.]
MANKDLTPSPELLASSPYEGAKAVFARVMSPHHALAATYLYRYFLKLTKAIPGKHSEE